MMSPEEKSLWAAILTEELMVGNRPDRNEIVFMDDLYRHAVKIPEITRRSRVKDYAPPGKSKFKKKPKFKGSKAARKAGRRK